jgi:hypothetical protein
MSSVRRPRDVHARGELEEVSLGVGHDVHRVPHVAHDDLGRPPAPRDRPARARAEHPGDVAPRLLERHAVIVELLHEGEVVEHGRHVEQLGVEGDAPRRGPAAQRYARTE